MFRKLIADQFSVCVCIGEKHSFATLRNEKLIYFLKLMLCNYKSLISDRYSAAAAAAVHDFFSDVSFRHYTTHTHTAQFYCKLAALFNAAAAESDLLKIQGKNVCVCLLA